MCLIAFALHQHPDYPLVLVANRDEFHHRPTRPMDWWQPQGPLAGRDEQAGGTWLALSPSGRLTALTNYRSGKPEKGHRSRGELPLDLLSAEDPWQRLQSLRDEQSEFSPFNLLCIEPHRAMAFGSEDPESPRELTRGIHGLSNHLLDTPWPKVQRGCDALMTALKESTQLHEDLIDAFRDDRQAPDKTLPDTGVGTDMERFLSPPFIRSGHYGTRATTVVTRDTAGFCQVSEQNYGPEGVPGERRYFAWQCTC